MHRVASAASGSCLPWAIALAATLMAVGCASSPPLRDAEAARIEATRERELLSVDLVGPTWALVRIQSMDDRVYVPGQPERFTLQFTADGQLVVRADCNRGHGTWTSEGRGSLQIGPLALTRAYCGDDSLDSRFLRDLDHVRSVTFAGERMHLATMADGAILEFEAIPADE